ncbi:hypothetical protein ACWC24_11500 [Streptomyces sp. NPDC001443]
MIWPAVLSGAALRVVRTAAGRRALQSVLLAGGLFALGLLCGERAHAPEGTPSRAAAFASYGSPSVVDGGVADVVRHRLARAGRAAPVHRAPAGDPDGVRVGRSDLDDATPRHGDAQAVPLDRRLPLWFVSGPTAAADATGTGDGHRDVPVSPA